MSYKEQHLCMDTYREQPNRHPLDYDLDKEQYFKGLGRGWRNSFDSDHNSHTTSGQKYISDNFDLTHPKSRSYGDKFGKMIHGQPTYTGYHNRGRDCNEVNPNLTWDSQRGNHRDNYDSEYSKQSHTDNGLNYQLKTYFSSELQRSSDYGNQFGNKISNRSNYKDFKYESCNKQVHDDYDLNHHTHNFATSRFKSKIGKDYEDEFAERMKGYANQFEKKIKYSTNYKEDHNYEDYNKQIHIDHYLMDPSKSSNCNSFHTEVRSRDYENKFWERTKQETSYKNLNNADFSKQIHDAFDLTYQSHPSTSGSFQREQRSRDYEDQVGKRSWDYDNPYGKTIMHEQDEKNHKYDGFNKPLHNDPDLYYQSHCSTLSGIKKEKRSGDYENQMGKRVNPDPGYIDNQNTRYNDKHVHDDHNSSYERPNTDRIHTTESKDVQFKSELLDNKSQYTFILKPAERIFIKTDGLIQKQYTVNENVPQGGSSDIPIFNRDYRLNKEDFRDIFDGFVICCFQDNSKPVNTIIKHLILANSFAKNKWGSVTYVFGHHPTDKRQQSCRILWNGITLSQGLSLGRHLAKKRAENQLLNKLTEFCYTLQVNESYCGRAGYQGKFNSKYVPGKFRLAAPADIAVEGNIDNFIDKFLQEDPDCEIWFGHHETFSQEDLDQVINYAKAQGLVCLVTQGSHAIVFNEHTPQYWCKKSLAFGPNYNQKFKLRSPGITLDGRYIPEFEKPFKKKNRGNSFNQKKTQKSLKKQKKENCLTKKKIEIPQKKHNQRVRSLIKAKGLGPEGQDNSMLRQIFLKYRRKAKILVNKGGKRRMTPDALRYRREIVDQKIKDGYSIDQIVEFDFLTEEDKEWYTKLARARKNVHKKEENMHKPEPNM